MDDFAGCFRFYRDVLGFAPTFGSEDEGGYADFQAGGRGLGIELASEPHDQPDWGLRVVHVRDPAGNLLELYRQL